MFAWLKQIFDRSDDPVYSCDLYHDEDAGSCAHVDGPLCAFPKCSMLAEYRQQKEGMAIMHVLSAPKPPAQPVKRMSADEIRAAFLSHGFEIKPGFDDLKPYVYAAARAIETACAAAWGVKLEEPND